MAVYHLFMQMGIRCSIIRVTSDGILVIVTLVIFVFGGYCGERSDGPKLLSGGLFGKKGGALAMYGVTPYPSQPLLKYPHTHYYLEGAYNHLGPESHVASKHYGGCK